MTGYPCFFTTGLVTPRATGFHLRLKHGRVGGCVVRGEFGSGDGSEEDNRIFSKPWQTNALINDSKHESPGKQN